MEVETARDAKFSRSCTEQSIFDEIDDPVYANVVIVGTRMGREQINNIHDNVNLKNLNSLALRSSEYPGVTPVRHLRAVGAHRPG